MWVLRGKKCWVSQLSTKSFFCVCVCVFVSAYCEQSLQGADDVVVLLSVCILNFNYYKTVVCCHVLPIALMLVVLASVLWSHIKILSSVFSLNALFKYFV